LNRHLRNGYAMAKTAMAKLYTKTPCNATSSCGRSILDASRGRRQTAAPPPDGTACQAVRARSLHDVIRRTATATAPARRRLDRLLWASLAGTTVIVIGERAQVDADALRDQGLPHELGRFEPPVLPHPDRGARLAGERTQTRQDWGGTPPLNGNVFAAEDRQGIQGISGQQTRPDPLQRLGLVKEVQGHEPRVDQNAHALGTCRILEGAQVAIERLLPPLRSVNLPGYSVGGAAPHGAC